MSKRSVPQIPAEDVPSTVNQLRDIRLALMSAQELVAPMSENPSFAIYDALERVDTTVCRLIQRLSPRER